MAGLLQGKTGALLVAIAAKSRDLSGSGTLRRERQVVRAQNHGKKPEVIPVILLWAPLLPLQSCSDIP